MEHNLGCRCAFWVNIDYELPCWWRESTKQLNEWVIRANDFSVVYLALLRFRTSVTCRIIIQGIRDCSIYMTTVMNNVHLNDLFFFFHNYIKKFKDWKVLQGESNIHKSNKAQISFQIFIQQINDFLVCTLIAVSR